MCQGASSGPISSCLSVDCTLQFRFRALRSCPGITGGEDGPPFAPGLIKPLYLPIVLRWVQKRGMNVEQARGKVIATDAAKPRTAGVNDCKITNNWRLVGLPAGEAPTCGLRRCSATREAIGEPVIDAADQATATVK